jgi:predicted RNase H-like HicB family nuclease
MRTARVIYHHESEGWWADSPDVPGWSAAGDSLTEVKELADEGVEFFLEEEVALVHELASERPVPVTAGTPATIVKVELAQASPGPHFEEQIAMTIGASNEKVPA